MSEKNSVEVLSGYKFATRLNEALRNNGIDTQVKPQMIYNYIKKGYIATNDEGFITLETFTEFATKYIAKKLATKRAAELESEVQL